MEKYSKHLEALVAERTQELILEQKKTANLLYSAFGFVVLTVHVKMFVPAGMLPRAVADDLKQDKPAPAKLFQSSTIYFRYKGKHLQRTLAQALVGGNYTHHL